MSIFYVFHARVYLYTVHIVANAISRSSADTLRLWAIAALMAVTILLWGYVQLLEPLVHWDAGLSLWMQTWRSPALDQLMLSITMMADLVLCLALLASVALWLLVKGQWWLCLYTGCAFFSTTLAVTVIKELTQRERPALSDTTVHLMSFPSGHAARAVIVLGLLALLISWGQSRRIRAYSLGMAAILSTLVGISRIYLGVHWPSDVLAGAALASMMLLCLDWQWQRADGESVNIGISMLLCAILYLGYLMLSIDEKRLIYGLPHF